MTTFTQQLASEIANDPLVLGYQALITAPSTDVEQIHKDPIQQGINKAIADLINSTATGRQRQRLSIPRNEIIAAFEPAEIAAVNAASAAKINWLPDNVNPNDDAARQIILDAFGGGSITAANLAAILNENISRATELGLPVIKPGYVAAARVMNIV